MDAGLVSSQLEEIAKQREAQLTRAAESLAAPQHLGWKAVAGIALVGTLFALALPLIVDVFVRRRSQPSP
jgi:hypothetical protein